jgi:Tol biopolymer transport system component
VCAVKRAALVAFGVFVAAGMAVPGWAGTAAKTELVSVNSTGDSGNDRSFIPSISASGRYVAFDSDASDLVPDDTNHVRDVFVRDMSTGETQRVSVSSAGVQGDRRSLSGSISADGRFVAFGSGARHLVPGDVGKPDIFVRDLATQTTQRISLSSAGAPGNSGSFSPSISASGRFVAFFSYASNLVSGDTNNAPDIFVRDLERHRTVRVTLGSKGIQAKRSFLGPRSPSISADGRYVAFSTDATNLVPHDTNGVYDVFVRDLKIGRTRRVSVNWRGRQGDAGSSNLYGPSISADGRFVAFDSFAHLTPGDRDLGDDIFVRDLRTHRTKLVSASSSGAKGNRSSTEPSISPRGRFVAFMSAANNLVPGDTNAHTDVFVHDLKTGATRRASLDSTGGQSNGHSYYPSISAGGRFVAFESWATLVPNDTNGGVWDIYRRGPL